MILYYGVERCYHDKMGYRLPGISLYYSLQLHMNLKLAQIKEFNFKKDINMFGFADHKVSAATTHLCPCGMKASMDSK